MVLIDNYFVPALAVLSERFKLSDDVAGATFMAAGASCPELFMGIMGAFSGSDVGVGTAVGASLFNMTCIVGAVAIVSPVVIMLNWRTLIREVLFFGFASLLLLASIRSELIHWWESLMLVSLYLVYVLVCAYYPSIQNRFCPIVSARRHLLSTGPDDKLSHEEVPPTPEPDLERLAEQAAQAITEDSAPGSATNAPSGGSPQKKPEAGELHSAYQAGAEEEEDEYKSAKPGEVQPEKAVFAGFLFKKARFYTRVGASLSEVYQKYWFSLSDHLYYYPDPRFPKKDRSYINLFAVTRVVRSERDPLVITLHGWGNMMNWRLRAWTEDIAAEWQMHLELRLRDIGRERSRGLLPPEEVIEEAIKKSDADDDEAKSLLAFPAGAKWYKTLVWLTMLPCFFFFTYTIPDVRASHWRPYWVVSIFMVVAWLAGFSYLVVFCADRLGCLTGITSDVIGITLAAVGAALPNMFASIAVARQGLGNMAIANAFGSNVFNLCIALGFPWFLKTCVVEPGEPYQLESESLNVLVLLLVVVLMAGVAVAVLIRMRVGYILGRGLILGYCVVLLSFLLWTHRP
eukprot:g49353.t1